jgi:hypothetical protein
MIPHAALTDRSRPRPFGVRSVCPVLLAGALVLLGTGCGKQPGSSGVPADPVATAPKADPWVVAGARLKKETDLTTCKSVLIGLRTDTNADETKRLPALSDDALKALQALVPFNSGDLEQIRGGPFTDHDAVYLADCLYLRDAARSLALTGLPVERQADLAFEWVCRQVYLYPWVRLVSISQVGSGTFVVTTLPPTAVLRRGWGSGLERMYVFLALLQQMGLDGCLIGGPKAGPSTALFASTIEKPIDNTSVAKAQALARTMARAAAVAPRGPFWAVGVRVGSDVRLFDPWRGGPVPWTLAQLRANPGAAKAWYEDKVNTSGATPGDVGQATTFLAVPVNALSARMAAFDKHLRTELGVRVSVDAAALSAAFPDPKPAFWNPPDDPFAYGRAARSYLPVEHGGTDPTPGSQARLYEASMLEQIPPTSLQTDPALEALLIDLPADGHARLARFAQTVLALAFVEQPNPRERIQRGRFLEEAQRIVARQDLFAAGAERLRTSKEGDEQIREWVVHAKKLDQALSRAQLSHDRGQEEAVLAEIERHWRAHAVQFLIDRKAVEVGLAESSLLLALCKHEVAERAQVRLGTAAPEEVAVLKPEVLAAWRTALSLWHAYEQCASAHAGFPGRAEHARALAARAAEFAAADAKK